MKATHVLSCAIALIAVSSSHAYALTGNYDGEYMVDYNLMDTTVTCGDFSEHLTVDLEEEQLPEDAFDALKAEAHSRIEAADLTDRQEQAAKAAADAFFAGLTGLANQMLLSYPDSLTISALVGNADVYAFMSDLADADVQVGENSPETSTVGYMNGGDFEMLPFSPSISLENYDRLNDYLSAVQVGANANGWIQDDAGEGELEWLFEVQSTGLIAGESLSCRVSNLVGFELSR